MKEHEIRQRLAELAELEPLRVFEGDSLRGARSTVFLDQPLYDGGANPLVGQQVVKIHAEPRPCRMGCGQTLKNQVIEYRQGQNPYIHWKVRCANCHNYLNPNGGDFIQGVEVSNAYARYFKNRPGDENCLTRLPDDK